MDPLVAVADLATSSSSSSASRNALVQHLSDRGGVAGGGVSGNLSYVLKSVALNVSSSLLSEFALKVADDDTDNSSLFTSNMTGYGQTVGQSSSSSELLKVVKDPCEFKKHAWLEEKFILMSLCGTSIAIMGILANIITAFVLTRPTMRSPNNMYLTTLAVFDACVLITGVGLYSIEYISEYTDNTSMYEVWVSYVSHIYALSHIAQTGSTYITVAVTVERFVAVVHPDRSKLMCSTKGSTYAIFWVICFAVLFNCTKFFEINVVKNSNCTGFATYDLEESTLQKNEVYGVVYSLWLTQMVMVFIPFLVLFVFNSIIAVTIRKSLQRLSWIQRGRKRDELKEKSREATYVLIVIVVLFLICNSWGLVMAIMERFYGTEYLHKEMPAFYTFSREAVNFLTIVNSSVNFVIYLIFGKDFRRELVHIYGCSFRLPMFIPGDDKFTARRLLVEQCSELATKDGVGCQQQFLDPDKNPYHRQDDDCPPYQEQQQRPSAVFRQKINVDANGNSNNNNNNNNNNDKIVPPATTLLNGCLKIRNRFALSKTSPPPSLINLPTLTVNLADLESTAITNGADRQHQPSTSSAHSTPKRSPIATPADPFAPFMLGVMLSAAPAIKNNAGSESPAVRIFYDHDDIYWV